MSHEKKYEFTGETLDWVGGTLHRIRALRRFITIDGFTVNIGDLGGWIASEKNLSQYGNCWVSGEGKVYQSARLFDNSRVGDFAEVYNGAILCDGAKVYNNASVFNYSLICGDGHVRNNANIGGRAVVRGYVYERAAVGSNAYIGDKGVVRGVSAVNHGALVTSTNDVITISTGPVPTTFYTMLNPTNIGIRVGVYHCGYRGEIDEFERLVMSVVDHNNDAKPFLHVISYVREHFGLNK